MIVIPAIDLKRGKCVRLSRGVMDTATVYSEDPAATAKRWEDAGAELIHVVDLEGAVSGSPKNLDAVAGIVGAVKVKTQLGGGIRDMATIERYLSLGIDRVVLGTAAVRDPGLLKEAAARYPGRVCLALDAKHGLAATQGWTESSDITARELAARCDGLGLAAIIYTDIMKDGMSTGPNIEATRALADAVKTPVIISGGVADLNDIERSLALAPHGVVGVITGRAIYTGSLDLAEAIRLAKGSKR